MNGINMDLSDFVVNVLLNVKSVIRSANLEGL